MDQEIISVHDVIIIGAGPCGLAVAARLRERTPSSLFTDSEHQRYHWMKASAHSKRTAKPERATRRSHTSRDRLLQGPTPGHGLDIAVLDATSDTWMSAWNEKFRCLQISHLRSPMFFHPDPRNRDGLLEYVYREGRELELKEIGGVIGKSLSKHQRKQKTRNSTKLQEIVYLDERDRNDYFRPSHAAFRAYCDEVAQYYHLENIVQKSQVSSITYDTQESPGLFTLETSTGTKKAKIVVFAAGAASKPAIPPESPLLKAEPQGSVSHAFINPNASFLGLFPEHLLRKIKSNQSSSVAVIGGGLTSAQVSAAAASAGISKIHHLVRGPLKVKHFDIDLPWVGKYKNYHLASFWSADDDEERWEMMRDARGGGSINPEYKKILNGLTKREILELRENTTIENAVWDEDAKMWTLETSPPMKRLHVDHVIYATGVPADFSTVPALSPLHATAPIKSVGGMPCLTTDLMWNEEMPFFFTGRLAGLRLGPAAGNLEGARQGAERIAWKVSELMSSGVEETETLSDRDRKEEEWRRDGVDCRRLGMGFENQFSILECAG